MQFFTSRLAIYWRRHAVATEAPDSDPTCCICLCLLTCSGPYTQSPKPLNPQTPKPQIPLNPKPKLHSLMFLVPAPVQLNITCQPAARRETPCPEAKINTRSPKLQAQTFEPNT